MCNKRLSSKSGLEVNVLDNGMISEMAYDGNVINQLFIDDRDEAIANVYLRIYCNDNIRYYPLINSDVKMLMGSEGRSIKYSGQFEECTYECTFTISESAPAWLYHIELKNITEAELSYDLVYCQDIGLAPKSTIRTNELYLSQYIDHHVEKDDECGYVMISRQNQKQNDKNPLVFIGSPSHAVGYFSDGYQFYGLSYKSSNVPELLLEEKLPNEIYQYEFALPGLAIRRKTIAPDASVQDCFTGYVMEDDTQCGSNIGLEAYKNATGGIMEELMASEFSMFVNTDQNEKDEENAYVRPTASQLFSSLDLTEKEIKELCPGEFRHLEFYDDEVGAFFYDREKHVVLKRKELLCERSHAHIMRSGSNLVPAEEEMAVTSWMNGVFASHVCIGNTSFNKFMTPVRNGLNVLRNSGQRILVQKKSGWQLLAVPSLFEMGMSDARWVYKDQEHVIEVRTEVSASDAKCWVSLRIFKGEPANFIITSNVIAGNDESDGRPIIRTATEGSVIRIEPNDETILMSRFPDASFDIIYDDSETLEKIRVSQAGHRQMKSTYIDLYTDRTSAFTVLLTGRLNKKVSTEEVTENKAMMMAEKSCVQQEKEDYMNTLIGSRYISGPKEEKKLSELNDLINWYVHNGMIHYLSPHGIEQYSGAAWGLRDVCQGPVELMLSLGHMDSVKLILKKIYSQQILETGDWRQWFMFDRYSEIQDSNSHNDIIAWPIKALCDYIEESNDFTILEEQVGFINDASLRPCGDEYAIIDHVLMQLEKIYTDVIEGTSLITYGHGDWEDTLQPSNENLRKRLVSPWTVALVYESLMRLTELLKRYNKDVYQRIEKHCENMAKEFRTLLMKDGVVSGLAYFGDGHVEHLLHPNDTATGVAYRLIPMNRGIISQLFEKDAADEHLEIIKEHMTFVDGVRLMNKPLQYQGGKETFFKRAESGANFGREIGMQYVHAHIRYLQALALMGKADDLFENIVKINHIGIESRIPSALPRQSNCYYSSSDAGFINRYSAQDNFSWINEGKVGIKGGWRIYSSGPGIYLAQLLRNFLGIRGYYDDILIDPVIPSELDGLVFKTSLDGKALTCVYNVKTGEHSPRAIKINGTEVNALRYSDNKYRKGGTLIDRAYFKRLLNEDDNIVEIYL